MMKTKLKKASVIFFATLCMVIGVISGADQNVKAAAHYTTISVKINPDELKGCSGVGTTAKKLSANKQYKLTWNTLGTIDSLVIYKGKSNNGTFIEWKQNVSSGCTFKTKASDYYTIYINDSYKARSAFYLSVGVD